MTKELGPPWVVPVVAQVLLFVLIAGMSASVDTHELKQQFKRCCGLSLGMCFQFILLPLVGYLTVVAAELPPVYGISLLAVTASPGGAYSNWWCSIFNADLALSIAMTTVSTVVSVGMTPVNLALYMRLAYGKVPHLHFRRLVLSIIVAVLAIFTGLGVSWFFPSRRKFFNKVGNIAGLCLIIFSAMISSKSEEPIWDKGPKFYCAVATPCLLGMLGSFFLGWLLPCLTKPEAVACTVETAYQNTGLALTIALASFDGADRPKAACMPLVYSVIQVIALPIFLAIAWKTGFTYAPRDEPLRRVIFKSWQPNSEVRQVESEMAHMRSSGAEQIPSGEAAAEETVPWPPSPLSKGGDSLAERPAAVPLTGGGDGV